MIHPMASNPINWKPIFLKALEEIPVVQHACSIASIHRATVSRARESDPEFKADMDEAMEAGIDKAEAEAYRRAALGWCEPVIEKGRVAYAHRLNDDGGYEVVLDEDGQPVPLTVRRYSDSLLQFVLKGRRRTHYGDKTEITGANGGPISTLDETAKAARVAALLAAAQERKDIA